jgi:hypothetical protein
VALKVKTICRRNVNQPLQTSPAQPGAAGLVRYFKPGVSSVAFSNSKGQS